MTMISRLGYKPTRIQTIISTKLKSTADITIVIPVKDNQAGIDLFLNEFQKTHSKATFPNEIIIVDNNSSPALKVECQQYPYNVRLLQCSKIGPASARNLGVENVKTDWIVFTDSDCVPTDSFLTGYLNAQNGSIGYAGNVKAYNNDTLSHYYEKQEILVPPKVYEGIKNSRPDYIITANCLVWREAFKAVGGFNEDIKIAGGEDIDLGFKLLQVGSLTYAYDSLSLHNFGNSLFEFRKRFKRYGQGNKIISELYGLNLLPKPFKPNNPSLIHYILAFMQYLWLLSGYTTPIRK